MTSTAGNAGNRKTYLHTLSHLLMSSLQRTQRLRCRGQKFVCLHHSPCFELLHILNRTNVSVFLSSTRSTHSCAPFPSSILKPWRHQDFSICVACQAIELRFGLLIAEHVRQISHFSHPTISSRHPAPPPAQEVALAAHLALL